MSNKQYMGRLRRSRAPLCAGPGQRAKVRREKRAAIVPESWPCPSPQTHIQRKGEGGERREKKRVKLRNKGKTGGLREGREKGCDYLGQFIKSRLTDII